MDAKEFADRCRKIRNGSPNAFYALVDAYCAQVDAATELDRQRREGVGVFNPQFIEDDDCREAQDNTPSLGPFKG